MGCLWKEQAWGVCGRSRCGFFVEGAGVGCLWKEQVWGVCGRSSCGVFVEGAGVGCLWKELVWGVCGRSRCGGVCGRSSCGVFVEGAGVGCLWKEPVWGVCGRSRVWGVCGRSSCGVFVEGAGVGCLCSPFSLASVGLSQRCFTSTETTRLVRDREPRTATSTFTQLLTSVSVEVILVFFIGTCMLSMLFNILLISVYSLVPQKRKLFETTQNTPNGG